MTEENGTEKEKRNRDGKLFNFRPVTICALFLTVGVLLSYAIIVLNLSLWILLFAVPCAALIAWCSLPFKKVLVWTLILLVASVIGGACFSYSIYAYRQYSIYDGDYAVLGRVVEKRDYDDGYAFLLEDVSVATKKEKGKLIAYLPASLGEKVRLSDEIEMFGKLTTKTEFTDDYGFRGDEISKCVAYSLSSVQSVSVLKNEFNLFLWIRQRVNDVLQTGLGNENAAFCAGLLLGDDEGIDKGILRNARYGGIAHVFAVSGLHVGVLFSVCAYLTKTKFFTKKPKIFSFLFTAIILLFYGGVCGFSVSVIRAIVTCLSAYGCRLLGGKRDSLEGVSLAAIIVLVLFPATLFEAGFLLSFSACYGILLLARPIRETLTVGGEKSYAFCREKILKKPKKQTTEVDVFKGDASPKSISRRALEKGVSFLSVTIAAWLAVAPVSVGFFGYASTWGVLLNCLFVPVISVFFVVLLIVTVVACVFPFAAPVLYWLLSGICALVLFLFEMIPFGSGKVPFSVPAAVCYYLSLLTATDKLAVNRRVRFGVGLGLIVTCALCLLAVIL